MAEIKLDTHKLQSYANRIDRAVSRLSDVDSRLTRLVQNTINVQTAFVGKGVVLRGGEDNLRRCSNYLKDTASDFNRVEKLLQGKNLSSGHAGAGGSSSIVDARSGFARFLNNELKTSGSVLHGEYAKNGELFGIGTGFAASGDILYGEAGIKNKMNWKFKDKDGKMNFKEFGLTTEAYATGALAKGEVEGNVGLLHGKIGGSALTASAKATARANLYNDGKFNPSLMLGVGAEATALHGEGEVGFGNDQFGAGIKADGDLLHAEAKAQAGIGYIETNKEGKAVYGVSAKAEAMACAAQGKVGPSFTLFGIDVDVKVKGYAGAAGVEAGASLSTDGVKANFGGAMALGAGLDVSIDWSDAKWVGDTADAVGDFVSDTASAVGDFASDAWNWAGNAVEDVGTSINNFGNWAADGLGKLFGG